MRHRATPLLHVLLSAQVAAIAAAVPALSVHAQGAAGAAPRPYLVVLDAGHGGSPDNAHPERAYDSGAVAANGLLEKDLTLDMVKRIAPMLRAQGVEVVLTRDTDVAMDISPRMRKALDLGADLFVSIHFNGWTDPAAAGSLVMYPKDFCEPFARTMALALTHRLAPFGVLPDGLQFRPEMFQQAAMPTVTLEPLYLTNAGEAGLISRADVRDAVARAVVDGIDAQAGSAIADRDALAARWSVFSSVLGLPSPATAGPPASVATAPAGGGATPVPDSIAPLSTPSPGSTPIPAGVGGAGHSDGSPTPAAGAAGAAGPRPPGGASGAPYTAETTPATGLPLAPVAFSLLGLALLILLRRPLLRGAARLSAGLMAAVAWLEGGEVPAIVRLDTRNRRRQARRRALLERSRRRGPAERQPVYDELFFRPRPRSSRR